MDEEREINNAMKLATTIGDDVQFNNPRIYPYQRKLDLLRKHEDNFIKQDKSAKENRLAL